MAALADAAVRGESRSDKSKFLVVVDDTPECVSAMQYAARRAQSVGGAVTLLYVIDPPDFQHWMSVGDVMREEARDEAMESLRGFAVDLEDQTNIRPELVVSEGDAKTEILNLIKADPDICFLILAAGEGKEGPGPLVTSFTGQLIGSMSIPVVIVPGHLTMDEIDRIV